MLLLSVRVFVAGAGESNAAAAQQADTACGSEGCGARRGAASLLCRNAAFHTSGLLADATAPAAQETAHAVPGIAEAPREACRAAEGVALGREPAGMSSSAESGPPGAAAPVASAGGGPRCQVCLAHQYVSPSSARACGTGKLCIAVLSCGRLAGWMHVLECRVTSLRTTRCKSRWPAQAPEYSIRAGGELPARAGGPEHALRKAPHLLNAVLPFPTPLDLPWHAQVESCRRELAGLSAYHQKCRICEVHLKAPCFERAGLPQRFCQRCGRCHELGAFQGAKRSCREQLAKHNARCAASLNLWGRP